MKLEQSCDLLNMCEHSQEYQVREKMQVGPDLKSTEVNEKPLIYFNRF